MSPYIYHDIKYHSIKLSRNMDRVGNSAEMNKDLIQQFVEEKLKKHQTMAAASQGIYYILLTM